MNAPNSTPAKNAPLLFALRLTNNVMNASDGTLERATSLCEMVAVFFGGVIFVGVAIEIWLAIAHFSQNSCIGYWGPVVADVLVAVGVGLEVLFGFRGNRLQSELTRRSRDRLSIREGLVNDSLMANARALRDNALATVAGMVTSERLAVAQDFIDRGTMTEAARSLDATAKVQAFAGKQFDAVATSSNINLETLKRTLCSGLKAAGWVEVEPSNGGDREQSSIGGDGLVKIQFDASNLSALGAAAEGLASALNSVGIAAFVTSIAPCDASNATAIHIVVGAKAERL